MGAPSPTQEHPTPVQPPTIWVVTASVGEYSDRREWAVTAFTSEGVAKAYVEAADAFTRGAEAALRPLIYPESSAYERELAKAFLGWQSDFGEGPRFYLQAIQLQEAFSPLVLPANPETARPPNPTPTLQEGD
jgi:hypothetical protein